MAFNYQRQVVMDKLQEDLIIDDFDLMHECLDQIQKHMLTRSFNEATHFYRPLRSIIIQASRDVSKSKNGHRSNGDDIISAIFNA